MTRRTLLRTLAALPAARLLVAQDQANATFSAGVKVVNLLATVRDRKGVIVKDLNKEDFQLDEEGQPQAIRYFTRESNLPLTLGLLVDTSGSTRRVLPDERLASLHFLQQVLREDKDMAFVIHFDFEVELMQDLTSSRVKLEKAIEELQTSDGRRQLQQRQGGGGYPGGGRRYPGGGGGGGGRSGGGTDMYDSILLASDEIMKKQQGRKALILLTDGVDTGSKTSLSSAIEAAQRSDTLVYSILFEDPEMAYATGPMMGRRGGWGGGGGGRGWNDLDGKKILQQISRETGARFFEVTRKEPIQKIFSDIEEELRNQYNIGYTPERADNSGAYRHVHLTTKQKGLIVQTREGYYPA